MGAAPELFPEYESFSPAPYNLTESEMHELVGGLLEERETIPGHRVVCYRLENDSPYADVARTVERQVFERYFGNDAETMAREYGPYESQSIFFLSVDQDTKTPIGVLRAIENGPAGMKTLNDLEATWSQPGETDMSHLDSTKVRLFHDIASYDDCWDVGTVAVRKQHLESKAAAEQASVQLYRALYVAALQENIDHFISIIDAKPYEKMTKYLGIPFVPMLESKPFSYLGSEASVAAYGHVTEFYTKMNRKRWTVRGALARRALNPLVKGTKDDALQL